MTSINGNSLCQILKRSYMFKDVPIIMISSNASPLNKATAESSGATDYLEKPFSKLQLLKVLETYLEIQCSP
ncbi:MAG: response regulator [Cyanobacteria bacterium J06636_28]